MKRILSLLAVLAVAILLSLDVVSTQGPHVAAASPYIDVHTHIEKAVAEKSLELATAAMQGDNRARYLFLPSPFDAGDPGAFDIELLGPLSKKYGNRIAVMGGGGSLNPMIGEAVAAGRTTAEQEKRFKERAEVIASQGAVGFGELTAEHRPSASTPSYQSAPPDHPLFLALADIAASHDMPLVLHMEAVDADMPLPQSWQIKGVKMPSMLRANIGAFERLLSHNPRARIVWAHGGWDNTGARTPQLMRRLLAAHPNLYSEIKIDPLNAGLNSPLAGGATGALKPEWLKLFQDFPDRFVIGSDQHYPMPENQPQRWQAVVGMFNQLPPAIRQKVGFDNVAHIYRMPK
jgi:predicted TIM-barrel fold metal-dependent hydrolase